MDFSYNFSKKTCNPPIITATPTVALPNDLYVPAASKAPARLPVYPLPPPVGRIIFPVSA